MYYHGHNLCWVNKRLHTANIVIGEAMYAPGGVCGPRVQRDFQLVILHSGQCCVTVDEERRELLAGRVYLFAPGHKEHFRFSLSQQTHHSYCSIRPGFLTQGMRQRLRRAPAAVVSSEIFCNLLAMAFKLHTPQDSPSAALLEQLGLCLFSEFLCAGYQSAPDVGQDPAMTAFQRYVENNFGKEDCLHGAHHAAKVSRNAMIEKFRRQMKSTPARYLWRFRTERGAAMLRETGHTVSEIAYRCGFKSPFHFSRLIKQHFGQSPKTLRWQAWTPGPPEATA